MVLIQRAAEFVHRYYLVSLSKEYDVVCLLKVQSDEFIHRLKEGAKARVVLYFGDSVWLDMADYAAQIRARADEHGHTRVLVDLRDLSAPTQEFDLYKEVTRYINEFLPKGSGRQKQSIAQESR